MPFFQPEADLNANTTELTRFALNVEYPDLTQDASFAEVEPTPDNDYFFWQLNTYRILQSLFTEDLAKQLRFQPLFAQRLTLLGLPTHDFVIRAKAPSSLTVSSKELEPFLGVRGVMKGEGQPMTIQVGRRLTDTQNQTYSRQFAFVESQIYHPKKVAEAILKIFLGEAQDIKKLIYKPHFPSGPAAEIHNLLQLTAPSR